MSVHDLRPKAGETKITINLGVVDLGQIDLLVQEGFYSNRTDFIRTSIRNQFTARRKRQLGYSSQREQSGHRAVRPSRSRPCLHAHGLSRCRWTSYR